MTRSPALRVCRGVRGQRLDGRLDAGWARARGPRPPRGSSDDHGQHAPRAPVGTRRRRARRAGTTAAAPGTSSDRRSANRQRTPPARSRATATGRGPPAASRVGEPATGRDVGEQEQLEREATAVGDVLRLAQCQHRAVAGERPVPERAERHHERHRERSSPPHPPARARTHSGRRPPHHHAAYAAGTTPMIQVWRVSVATPTRTPASDALVGCRSALRRSRRIRARARGARSWRPARRSVAARWRRR